MAFRPISPSVPVVEVISSETRIAGAKTAVTAIIGPTRHGLINQPRRISSVNDFARRFGPLTATSETGFAVQQFFANGGRDLFVVRVAKNARESQFAAGLEAVSALEEVRLLALPGTVDPLVIGMAARICREHRMLLLADPPGGATAVEAISRSTNQVAPEDRSWTALFHPWVRITNPLDGGRPRLVPPSATIAGLMARTDAERGVWKAPAGLDATLKGVIGLEREISDAEQGQLNPRGINCLRRFSGSGFVAWGARTLAGGDPDNPEFKYIPVRRLAQFIQTTLLNGLQWTVFEANAEPLWARLRLRVGAFLNELFRQGAFQGRTPEEAYFVRCGADTTSANEIAAGRVCLLVGIAPLKPAEFVLLRLTLTAGSPGT